MYSHAIQIWCSFLLGFDVGHLLLRSFHVVIVNGALLFKPGIRTEHWGNNYSLISEVITCILIETHNFTGGRHRGTEGSG